MCGWLDCGILGLVEPYFILMCDIHSCILVLTVMYWVFFLPEDKVIRIYLREVSGSYDFCREGRYDFRDSDSNRLISR